MCDRLLGTRICNHFLGCEADIQGTVAYTKLARDNKTVLYAVEFDDGDTVAYPEAEVLVSLDELSLLITHWPCVTESCLYLCFE